MIRSPASRCKGFSLVELLMVLGILFIMIGLLLPAVQAARSAARRISCESRLRQIGQAAMQYHDAYRLLPNGTASDRSSMPQASWMLSLLPFLEENRLYQLAQDEFQGPLEYELHAGFTTVVPLYICPEADRESDVQNVIRQGLKAAVTDYLGCNGTNYAAKDGVLFFDSKVRFRDIIDGQSQTILVGERPPSRYFDYGWWYAAHGTPNGTGTLDHTIGFQEIAQNQYRSCPPGAQFPQLTDPDDDCNSRHFWSRHPFGLHFVNVDASVRFYSYSGIHAFGPLATRAGSDLLPIESQ